MLANEYDKLIAVRLGLTRLFGMEKPLMEKSSAEKPLMEKSG